MIRREVRWQLVFPDELEAAIAEFPIVYMPYGQCEPHGPQTRWVVMHRTRGCTARSGWASTPFG